jgi:SAM-dependent methyltransferase
VYRYLKNIYRHQSFFPGFLGLLTNPFYFARKGLYEAIKNFSLALNGRLLDVGCGSQPYAKLFFVKEYTGLEIDSSETRARGIADFYYDGTTFPFNDGQFDSVLCNQVFEHVFNPNLFMDEVSRVLKPGGKLLLSVPFVWDEHEQPNDYARYSSFALKFILERHGFELISQIKTCADATTIFQVINAYLYKIVAKRSLIVQLILTVTVIAIVNIAGVIIGKILPKNPDLYLDNVVLAEKIS